MPKPIANLEQIQALDRAHVIHPINEFRKHEARGPTIISGGRGVELYLGDGRTLLDGFSGLFNINVGHGRTEIAEAVATQMRELAYYPSFWNFGNEPAARLAARIAALLPADRGLGHFLFHNSVAAKPMRRTSGSRGCTTRSGASRARRGSSRGAGPITAQRVAREAPPGSSSTTC